MFLIRFFARGARAKFPPARRRSRLAASARAGGRVGGLLEARERPLMTRVTTLCASDIFGRFSSGGDSDFSGQLGA